ncbi:MAG: 30S ribosomal protein S15 [Candidatus Paceibacteria bacterium]
MLDEKKKQEIIEEFQLHEDDTGSSPVQIALLTAEIGELSEHLENHPQDHSSRRGLLKKVGKRRKLMKYLQEEDPEKYAEVVNKLDLKQAKNVNTQQDSEE